MEAAFLDRLLVAVPAPPRGLTAAAVGAARTDAARRRHAADPLAFAADCLPAHFHLPVPPSAFHLDMLGAFARLRAEGAAGRSVREVHEAPRSWAKSTYAATLLPMLACCLPEIYGLRYLVLARARTGLAEEDVEALRRLLESDPVRAVYGDLRGRTWNRGLIVTSGGVRVQAAGLDQANRGLRDPATGDRPDLVVIDDPDKDAQSRAVRGKLRANLKGALLGMQGVGRPMHVLAVGTVVDSQATVRWLRDQPGFRHCTYRALTAFPDETDGLWAEWGRIFAGDPEAGPAQAHAFYEARRAAMDAGATGMWEGDPLERVMEARLVMGPARFAAEKLNDPRGGDDALIRPEWIRWWGVEDGDDAPEGGEAVDAPATWRAAAAALDPALGKRGGDLTALVGGRLAADGRIFVEVADCARMPPHAIPARAAAVCAAVGATVLRTEEVGAFELLHEPLVAAMRAAGLTCAVESWRPPTDKQARLQGLQPLLRAGLVVLHASLRGTPLDQLLSVREDGRSSEHDDFPDALEMLIGRLRAMSGAGALSRRPPAAGRNGHGFGDLAGGGLGDLGPGRGGRTSYGDL